MQIETTIAILNLEDVPACFDVESETYPAEPYSWGGSRGLETETSATLLWAMIGDFKADREAVGLMVGGEQLDHLEEAMAQ